MKPNTKSGKMLLLSTGQCYCTGLDFPVIAEGLKKIILKKCKYLVQIDILIHFVPTKDGKSDLSMILCLQKVKM